MLEVKGIRSGYGDVTVLKGLEFSVGHEVFAILGANGAGKTTLMKTLARVLPLSSGTLAFKGDDVTHTAPFHLAQAGLSLVPQEDNIFPDLSVREHLSIGGLLGDRRKDRRTDEVLDLFPALRPLLGQKAGTLSGGEAQMVAVGRALMQDPELLLLDEPTAGLAPKYVDDLFGKIREIHETRDVSIVLTEQNAAKTLAIADRVMVLRLGEIFLIESTANVDMETLKEGYKISMGTRESED